MKKSMLTAGREFLEKQKKIRATIVVDMPYDNELMNYGNKLNDKIRTILNQQYICCQVEAGYLRNDIGIPIITEKKDD